MALKALKDSFTGKAAAAGMAAALAMTPFAGATAQDAQQQQQAEFTQASATTNIAFSPDAHSEANDYLRQNPSGFAVAIRIGGETQVPLDRIQSVLDSDLRGNGVTNARFFFERGQDVGGSSVVFATTSQVHGPYGLADARKAAAEAAEQYRFERTLALN